MSVITTPTHNVGRQHRKRCNSSSSIKMHSRSKSERSRPPSTRLRSSRSSSSKKHIYDAILCQFCGRVHICRAVRLYDFLPPLTRDVTFDDYVVTSSAVVNELFFLKQLVDDLCERKTGSSAANGNSSKPIVTSASSTASRSVSSAVAAALSRPVAQLTVGRRVNRKAIYQQSGNTPSFLVVYYLLLTEMYVLGRTTGFQSLRLTLPFEIEVVVQVHIFR